MIFKIFFYRNYYRLRISNFTGISPSHLTFFFLYNIINFLLWLLPLALISMLLLVSDASLLCLYIYFALLTICIYIEKINFLFIFFSLLVTISLLLFGAVKWTFLLYVLSLSALFFNP